MDESGAIKKGTTQIGEVRRPLAAVSKVTKANNIVFFSDGCDYIIDRRDPLAAEIIKMVERAKLKTKMYLHKGTYRIRAWVVPTKSSEDNGNAANPFGRQGP